MRSIIGAPLKQFPASVLRTLLPMAASLAILPMIGGLAEQFLAFLVACLYQGEMD
jgi:hypothetical protein